MSIVIISFKVLSALLGLIIPGYALARALQLKACPAAAFPFSALILCQTVTAFAAAGVSITFAHVASALALLTGCCWIVAVKRKAPPENTLPGEAPPATADRLLTRISIAATVLLLAAAAFRTTLYPLGGYDTFTRWDALAREMLAHGSLSFYPPTTGADFSIYVMPDGFPPLVASVYWWIYAASGTAAPQLTTISVTLQLASILGLTWTAAATAFGNRAAALTLLSLATSPLLLRSVQIGQESGFLALAVAGQVCFALFAVHRSALPAIYGAALFGALAATAREYGPAVVLPGLFILLSDATTRRYSWRYVLLAAATASPWYLRNWFLTGTPLYPLTLPGAPDTNVLLGNLMEYYGEIFSITGFGAKEWLDIGFELLIGGSIAMLAGIYGLVIKWRDRTPYILSVVFIVLLWLWSISKTSGGVIYSMRVLAPAIVILAMIAGKALTELPESIRRRQLALLFLPITIWGVLSVLSFPLDPINISASILSTKAECPEFCEPSRRFAEAINRQEIPATGILTDSPYLAVVLQRETRFRPVIIWSREVSTILSRNYSSGETGKLLQERGITLVALNRSSIHNDFLFRKPFYFDGAKTWQEVTALDDWVLLALKPVSAR